MNELKWIWTLIAVFIIAFTLGYISGLNIPNHVEFGIDQKTLDMMNKVYNESNGISCTSNEATKIKVDCDSDQALIKYNDECYGCTYYKIPINNCTNSDHNMSGCTDSNFSWIEVN